MERSSGLEDWARELFASTDPDRLVDAHSTSDDVLVIGTDEDEWIEGGDAVAAAWRSQDLSGIKIDEVRCYEEGTVAWMAARVRFQLPDGSELPARVTSVAHKEGGSGRSSNRIRRRHARPKNSTSARRSVIWKPSRRTFAR